jgi:hypothetical protein
MSWVLGFKNLSEHAYLRLHECMYGYNMGKREQSRGLRRLHQDSKSWRKNSRNDCLCASFAHKHRASQPLVQAMPSAVRIITSTNRDDEICSQIPPHVPFRRTLIATNFFSSSCRDGLGPLQNTYLLIEAGWKEQQIGVVMFFNLLATMLVQIFAGDLIDKVPINATAPSYIHKHTTCVECSACFALHSHQTPTIILENLKYFLCDPNRQETSVPGLVRLAYLLD